MDVAALVLGVMVVTAVLGICVAVFERWVGDTPDDVHRKSR